MLNEFAKIAGDDCEVQISDLRLHGRMAPDYTKRYLAYDEERPSIPGYFVVVTDYARTPQIAVDPEMGQ